MMSLKEKWNGKALKKYQCGQIKQTQIPCRIIRAFLQLEQEEGTLQYMKKCPNCQGGTDSGRL